MKKLGDKLVVRVTAKDIAKGLRKDATHCPIAIAVGRTYHASTSRHKVVAQVAILQVWRRTRWHIFEMPVEARRFMANFDQGRSVKPFTFAAERVNYS